MGDLVGSVIGGIGSIVGSQITAGKEDEAANTAMTGYNYLQSNPLLNSTQSNATTAQDNQNNQLGWAGVSGGQQSAALGGVQPNLTGQTTALGAQGQTQGAISDLLTNGSQSPAFQNYLNSTGYGFQLQQGSDAITGNAASKGLLNSGATGKALTSYGQNLASTTFNNYLNQLGTLQGQQGSLASGYGTAGTNALSLAQGYGNLTNNTVGIANAYGGQVGQGLATAQAIGQAGTTGGSAAASAQRAAGESEGTGITQAFNGIGGATQNSMNNGTFSNFFSTPAALPAFY